MSSAVDKKQREADAIDFNAEIAGVENGRVKRFLSPDARDALLIAQGKKARSFPYDIA